jgi:hypothetical protein
MHAVYLGISMACMGYKGVGFTHREGPKKNGIETKITLYFVIPFSGGGCFM